jgi:hypothetical protein
MKLVLPASPHGEKPDPLQDPSYALQSLLFARGERQPAEAA